MRTELPFKVEEEPCYHGDSCVPDHKVIGPNGRQYWIGKGHVTITPKQLALALSAAYLAGSNAVLQSRAEELMDDIQSLEKLLAAKGS